MNCNASLSRSAGITSLPHSSLLSLFLLHICASWCHSFLFLLHICASWCHFSLLSILLNPRILVPLLSTISFPPPYLRILVPLLFTVFLLHTCASWCHSLLLSLTLHNCASWCNFSLLSLLLHVRIQVPLLSTVFLLHICATGCHFFLLSLFLLHICAYPGATSFYYLFSSTSAQPAATNPSAHSTFQAQQA